MSFAFCFAAAVVLHNCLPLVSNRRVRKSARLKVLTRLHGQKQQVKAENKAKSFH